MAEKTGVPGTAKESVQKIQKQIANFWINVFKAIGIPTSLNNFYLLAVKWGAIAVMAGMFVNRVTYFIVQRILFKSAAKTASSLMGVYKSLVGGVLSSAMAMVGKKLEDKFDAYLVDTFWQAVIWKILEPLLL